ncbi:MAG: hypothetical protein GQ531_03510 [Sulfurovum sp.]|nr:hypothetical protein [Sulfurovum sp.]
MKNIILAILFLSVSVFAEVIMRKAVPKHPIIEQPIERPDRPINRPVRPVPAVINPGIIYRNNYYNPSYVTNCEQYISQLREKDEEIAKLRSELAVLRSGEQAKRQKKLTSSYEAELKKFDNRKSSIKSTNSVIISDKPEK